LKEYQLNIENIEKLKSENSAYEEKIQDFRKKLLDINAVNDKKFEDERQYYAVELDKLRDNTKKEFMEKNIEISQLKAKLRMTWLLADR
jgi:predicted RNase H-like nuclease (RuvC/YqgF family)